MKMIEIRKQTEKELEKMLEEKRQAVRQFRFDITGSKAKNVKEGASMKKDVARIMTELGTRKAQ